MSVLAIAILQVKPFILFGISIYGPILSVLRHHYALITFILIPTRLNFVTDELTVTNRIRT